MNRQEYLAQKKEESIRNHTHMCKGCGIEYFNKRKGKEGSKYCSRECAYKYRHKVEATSCRLPEYSLVYMRECTECCQTFASRHKAQITCGTACRDNRINRLTLELYYSKAHIRAVTDCIECGITYSRLYAKDNKGKICSDECINSRSRRISKSYGKSHRARARRYKAKIIEGVKPALVFNKDKWKCQLCGCDTPKELRGTMDDSAPELDHKIPLSKGGDHTYDNTQCLCRACNIFKGVMSDEEYIQWNQGRR